jgi:hypothetical protein
MKTHEEIGIKTQSNKSIIKTPFDKNFPTQGAIKLSILADFLGNRLAEAAKELINFIFALFKVSPSYFQLSLQLI